MIKQIIIFCILIVLLSCSGSTEPEDLSYTAIQYHESEVVAGELIYYVTFAGGTPASAFIDDRPPGTNFAIGMWIKSGKDFDYNEKKWHCRTVKSTYIEIAAYD